MRKVLFHGHEYDFEQFIVVDDYVYAMIIDSNGNPQQVPSEAITFLDKMPNALLEIAESQSE